MSLWEKLLVSLVPVVCEIFLLQEMYRALFRQQGDLRRRLISGLLFIIVVYPIVFLTDNPEYFANLGPVRTVLVFMLFAFMLKAAFSTPFFARCLPAAAVFLFVSVVLETVLWSAAVWAGLEIMDIRFTFWKVLLFQSVLYAMEMLAVLGVKKLRPAAGYPEAMGRGMWLSTVGYLLVVSIFWIGLVQQVGGRFRTGSLGLWEIAGIVACLAVSLLFIGSSMGISQEMARRRIELEAQELELDYQRMYSTGIEAMLGGLSGFRHNYGNALASLSGHARLGEWEKLRECIEDLCREKDVVLSPSLEGLSALKNGALSGLFAAKIQRAKELGVDFNLSVKEAVGTQQMKTIDLCRAVGILLDNAVEAASNSTEKTVRAEVFRSQNGTVFHIRNTVDSPPPVHRMAQKGYTTKQGGSGLGLYLLEGILKQYPGVFLNTLVDKQHVVQELCV